METVLVWKVLGDDSPPLLGEVFVGEYAAYWGVNNLLPCSFEAALDGESGIVSYSVALVGSYGVCGDLKADGYGGKPLDTQELDCDEIVGSTMEVELAATLVHGASYRCVVSRASHVRVRVGVRRASALPRAAAPTIHAFCGHTRLLSPRSSIPS